MPCCPPSGYVAQALASVAYQINLVATDIEAILAQQNEQLGQLHATISLPRQTITMHQEQLGRRSIATLTQPRRIIKSKKIVQVFQPKPGPPGPVRQELDFSALDKIGAGGIEDVSGSGPVFVSAQVREERRFSKVRHGQRQRTTKATTPPAAPTVPRPILAPVAPPMVHTTEDCHQTQRKDTEPVYEATSMTATLFTVTPPSPPSSQMDPPLQTRLNQDCLPPPLASPAPPTCSRTATVLPNDLSAPCQRQVLLPATVPVAAPRPISTYSLPAPPTAPPPTAPPAREEVVHIEQSNDDPVSSKETHTVSPFLFQCY